MILWDLSHDFRRAGLPPPQRPLLRVLRFRAVALPALTVTQRAPR